ncbi:marine proteobacterial sortase target protein [Pseudoalteromonas sp. H105]|uniref:marine proteobacterial sortase target protein n=1 Tax=Pseudoalteromonas sp. H105 TaxID=1348393 RepID=UPI0007323A1C|nr:marine proteobacterial sortase target protein [Pseudoalteromonas sp. H105]KTF15749.1 alpha-1-antitrypsin [Pseudoalteromonas sp. H105]
MLSRPSKVLTQSYVKVWISLFILVCSFTPCLVTASTVELQMYDSQGAAVASGVILQSDAKMTVTGLINHVIVTQHYRNENPFAVNARYIFPLPDESAVHAMTMRIGERIIKGQIDKKEQAEQRFQHAKKAGKQAAIVRQQRANMFTTNVANINPGETVIIELEYQQVIDYRSGTFALRFPTTITPRYHPLNGELSAVNSEDNKAINKPFVPNGWISPVYQKSAGSTPESRKFSLTINIDVGLELVDIDSKYHQIAVTNPQFGHYQIVLDESNAVNRDFLLEFKRLQKEQAQAAYFTEQLENGERYGLLMLMPPDDHFTQTQRLPREMVFVIDTSGSMHGQSMEQAKSALYYALSLLDANDSFNIIGFDDQVAPMSQHSVAANDFNLRRAKRFVYNLKADGGTNIKDALDAVLDNSEQDGFVRQVVFLTDGSVSNEAELFTHIRMQLGDTRLFTVGIGSAPNSYFMRRAADVGRGTFTFIGSTHDVQPKMQQLFNKLTHPAITQLTLQSSDKQLEYWPSPLPDLYFSEPVMVAIKLSNNEKVTLLGQTAQGPLNLKLNAQQGQNAVGIGRLWARQKIKSLLLYNDKQIVKEQVQNLALEHQLLSPFTAFFAIEQTAINTPAEHDVQVANTPVQGLTMRLPQTDGQSRLHMLLGCILLTGFAFLRVKK